MSILLTFTAMFFATVMLFSKNQIASAFSLLLVLLSMAGIFFELGSPFLAVIQVIVYAGAITILFVFVLMFFHLPSSFKKEQLKLREHLIMGLTSLFLITLSFIFYYKKDFLKNDLLPYTDMYDLFSILFEKYLVPFELLTLLLFATILAVVMMTKEKFKD
ncbi:MAG: NADH-quinone oxidoreductase subunit J [Bacteriovoracaceae bacterium]|nr:NADH-quinone oxidoreductase subunit J [Bacteriovoracaceae bacterium]